MPTVATRLRRRVGRDVRWAASNVRSPRARFARGCDIRSGLRLHLEDGGAVDVGPGCVLDHGTVLAALGGRLQIGARTVLGHHCTIAATRSVRIGADCLLAEFVSIRDHDHASASTAAPMATQGRAVADVVIGDDVWIGAKATVVKGVTIGDHAIVGAGAVVTHDVPELAVVAGVPARVLRYRTGGNP